MDPGKKNLLQSSRTVELFIRTLYAYRERGKYLLHEFVVMPDHFHVLLTVDADTTIEKAIQLIKGGFAIRAGKELGIKTPFWQQGFSEIRVFDSDAFANQREYIRKNPVEAPPGVRGGGVSVFVGADCESRCNAGAPSAHFSGRPVRANVMISGLRSFSRRCRELRGPRLKPLQETAVWHALRRAVIRAKTGKQMGSAIRGD